MLIAAFLLRFWGARQGFFTLQGRYSSMPVSPPSKKEEPVRTVIGAAARDEHSIAIHPWPQSPPIVRAECSKMVSANTVRWAHPLSD
jgi:hypothetical protein